MRETVMEVKCKGEWPTYANDYAAGLDLRANEDILIEPGQIVDIKSMLAVALPKGYFGTSKENRKSKKPT